MNFIFTPPLNRELTFSVFLLFSKNFLMVGIYMQNNELYTILFSHFDSKNAKTIHETKKHVVDYEYDKDKCELHIRYVSNVDGELSIKNEKFDYGQISDVSMETTILENNENSLNLKQKDKVAITKKHRWR